MENSGGLTSTVGVLPFFTKVSFLWNEFPIICTQMKRFLQKIWSHVDYFKNNYRSHLQKIFQSPMWRSVWRKVAHFLPWQYILELQGIAFLEENHAQEISVESEKPTLRKAMEVSRH